MNTVDTKDIKKEISTCFALMKYCHMPLPFKASLRRMKLGDLFILGHVEHYEEGVRFVGQAAIRKVRGLYLFEAIWTVPTKPTRPDYFVRGEFKLSTGYDPKVIVDSTNHEELKRFALVCRYINWAISNMSLNERKSYREMAIGLRPGFQGLHLREDMKTRELFPGERVGDKLQWIRYHFKDDLAYIDPWIPLIDKFLWLGAGEAYENLVSAGIVPQRSIH